MIRLGDPARISAHRPPVPLVLIAAAFARSCYRVLLIRLLRAARPLRRAPRGAANRAATDCAAAVSATACGRTAAVCAASASATACGRSRSSSRSWTRVNRRSIGCMSPRMRRHAAAGTSRRVRRHAAAGAARPVVGLRRGSAAQQASGAGRPPLHAHVHARTHVREQKPRSSSSSSRAGIRNGQGGSQLGLGPGQPPGQVLAGARAGGKGLVGKQDGLAKPRLSGPQRDGPGTERAHGIRSARVVTP
eukprot:366005-Chlamydomonas_euryale.AAC.1